MEMSGQTLHRKHELHPARLVKPDSVRAESEENLLLFKLN